MTVGVFLVGFAVGAGLIALWIDVRFPGLAPDFRRTLLHVGISIVLAQLIVPILGSATPAGNVPGLMLLLFCIVLPTLVYCFLASVWVIKVVQGAMRHR